MCVNYAPIQRQILKDIFGGEPPPRNGRQKHGPTTLPPSWLSEA